MAFRRPFYLNAEVISPWRTNQLILSLFPGSVKCFWHLFAEKLNFF